MPEIPEDLESIYVTEEEAGIRLDKLLAQRFTGIQSRTYFQMLIDEQLVLLNSIPVKKRTIPHVGDEIQIQFILSPEMGLSPEPIPLDVLFEDEHIIAINKPIGMVVHPAVGNWTGTVANALLYHCKELERDDSLRPGIVHRLDKNTSGVLLAAKTATSRQRLVEMFGKREIYKEYVAVCIGRPGEGEIATSIGRHPIHRQMMAVVTTGGKPALTQFKTIASNDKVSLVQVVLATGRTHQIRVHMKHHGTPILGDPVYGNMSANQKHGVLRQLLHARQLRFQHPITGVACCIEAPLPEDIATWQRKLS